MNSPSEHASFFAAYVEAALWSSNDESTPEGGEPMDRNYGPEDIHPDTLDQMEKDCAAFYAAHGHEFVWENLTRSISCAPDEYAGHDFWLTRNGHGCGFWDGDWKEELGRRLTNAAKEYGEFNLYIGDDGEVHGT